MILMLLYYQEIYNSEKGGVRIPKVYMFCSKIASTHFFDLTGDVEGGIESEKSGGRGKNKKSKAEYP